ncbi:Mov34/MPN/PAD-1 family protein [Paraburkholderia aspalathi]|uniref:Mov34/MPN/PAD-1 family protein n=1 Tax=Paraburkholderia aspalathi TaxID=1324617 RepID=UPI003CB1A79A
MSQLWIDSTAFGEMLDEARRAYPLETGGVLVGYIADNDVPVVQHVIGPGLAARHRRHRFHPDHEWQCHRLDELFAASLGQAVYLGDWHTHPDGSPRMSWLDRRTLRGIARHREAQLSRPLMLIVGGGRETWNWRVHRYGSDVLIGFDINFDVLSLHKFQCASSSLVSDLD